MTVIAWDGESLAIDRLALAGDLASTTKKYSLKTEEESQHVGGHVAVYAGALGGGIALARWYNKGHEIREWPVVQATEDWSHLVVLTKSGIKFYEQACEAQTLEDTLQAFGSGRDFALGAMSMGATAKEAVEVASKFCASCGKGVDVFSFKEGVIQHETFKEEKE